MWIFSRLPKYINHMSDQGLFGVTEHSIVPCSQWGLIGHALLGEYTKPEYQHFSVEASAGDQLARPGCLETYSCSERTQCTSMHTAASSNTQIKHYCETAQVTLKMHDRMQSVYVHPLTNPIQRAVSSVLNLTFSLQLILCFLILFKREHPCGLL